jgi:hypothetical protein
MIPNHAKKEVKSEKSVKSVGGVVRAKVVRKEGQENIPYFSFMRSMTGAVRGPAVMGSNSVGAVSGL